MIAYNTMIKMNVIHPIYRHGSLFYAPEVVRKPYCNYEKFFMYVLLSDKASYSYTLSTSDITSAAAF